MEPLVIEQARASGHGSSLLGDVHFRIAPFLLFRALRFRAYAVGSLGIRAFDLEFEF